MTIRNLLAASMVFAALAAVPAAATTTIINFNAASCTGGCGFGSPIDQSFGDTADVDVTYAARNAAGNGTSSGSLLYWPDSYSGSDAVYANDVVGEVRLDVLNPGTLTINSIALGGWPNVVRTIEVRIYDLGYNLFYTTSVDTTPAALLTVNFGFNSTNGAILQFGPDAYNGGIQNVSFSFDSDVVPEPASWAMLIAGFGLVGATMRRRRAAIA